MSKFNFLYYFESDEVALVESKRLDLPTSASLSEVYRWTAYFKKRNEFVFLNFRSMTKREFEEIRSFNEGELHFNRQRGELTLKNEGQIYDLRLLKVDEIPETFKHRLEEFLN